MNTPSFHWLHRIVAIAAASAAASASTGCGSEAPVSAEAESVANGIDCDVDYSRLDEAWATRLHIVEPTEHRISDEQRIRHVNELALMPEASKRLFVEAPLDVALTGGSIVEFDEFANLRGVTPPGWPAGMTWDVVPGTASTRAVFLGDSGRPNNAYSLAIHEATHTIDLHTALSTRSTKLRALYAADRAAPRAAQDSLTAYRLGTILEYIAVAVDEHACNVATRTALKRRFPALYDYVENDFEREVEQFRSLP